MPSLSLSLMPGVPLHFIFIPFQTLQVSLYHTSVPLPILSPLPERFLFFLCVCLSVCLFNSSSSFKTQCRAIPSVKLSLTSLTQENVFFPDLLS